MTCLLWPLLVREAAEEVFGGSIHNVSGRTHKALDLRVQHAFSVWSQRYVMNPEQHNYAGIVLAWAIKRGHVSGKPFPYQLKAISNEMERVVNSPDVHAGFKRRAALVDVREQLAEMTT